MNHWLFVGIAYAIAIVPTVLLVGFSFAAMRRAERQAEALTRRD